MVGTKTNEREGTRAVLRHSRTSATKVRAVLDLIRGREVGEARDILRFCERDVALLVGKLLASAVANAENNNGLDPDELFVSACYADEGTTMKRWRPRARGRATRIRKRTSHVTVIVSRLPEDRLARSRARHAADLGARRARRVEAGRKARPTRRDARMPGTAPAPEQATPQQAAPAQAETSGETTLGDSAETTETTDAAEGTVTADTTDAAESTERAAATDAADMSEQTEEKGE
ncbi:MAG: 50S ribosomal protein L22 [Actinomycetota bacterium]|nr:50S ribosomal protein L22 [Actinomycetota bacterium]